MLRNKRCIVTVNFDSAGGVIFVCANNIGAHVATGGNVFAEHYNLTRIGFAGDVDTARVKDIGTFAQGKGAVFVNDDAAVEGEFVVIYSIGKNIFTNRSSDKNLAIFSCDIASVDHGGVYA